MTHMDSRGRVVLPLELRRELGIGSDTELGFQEMDGGILIRPRRPVRDALKELCGAMPADAERPVKAEDVKRMWERE